MTYAVSILHLFVDTRACIDERVEKNFHPDFMRGSLSAAMAGPAPKRSLVRGKALPVLFISMPLWPAKCP